MGPGFESPLGHHIVADVTSFAATFLWKVTFPENIWPTADFPVTEQFCAGKFAPGTRPRLMFIKESISLNRTGKLDILALEEEAAQSPL